MGRLRALTLLTFMSLLAAGCDPALSLRPVGLRQSDELEWTTEKSSIRFGVPRLGGLIGSEQEIVTLTIENPTSSSVVVDDAVLESKGRTYFAKWSAKQRRSVEPGATGSINLWFSFDQPIFEVFGDTARLRVNFRVGSEKDSILVNFERQY